MSEQAAPPVPPYEPPANGAAVPAKKSGASRARRFGDGLGNLIGQALGALVVFPVGVGLAAVAFYWFFSDGDTTYEQPFLYGAGLAFLFGLFVLVVRWGFALFIRFWPIILVIVGIVIAWKALT